MAERSEKMPAISQSGKNYLGSTLVSGKPTASNLRNFEKILVCSNCYFFYKEIERKKNSGSDKFELRLEKKKKRAK